MKLIQQDVLVTLCAIQEDGRKTISREGSFKSIFNSYKIRLQQKFEDESDSLLTESMVDYIAWSMACSHTITCTDLPSLVFPSDSTRTLFTYKEDTND